MRAHQERMAAAAATVSTPEGVRAALAELTAAWTKGRPPPARTRAQASAELHAMIAAEAAEAKAAGETRH